jgi:starch phosphorylase
MEQRRNLEPYAEDAVFRKQWQAVKLQNKIRLADISHELTGLKVNPDSIFDFQVKRIHEYKRQLMNILHVIYLWLTIKENPDIDIHPRTFFFGGKAAPGYHTAKTIIRLICHTAEMINRDTSTQNRLNVVFLPNYRVSLAERIFPAADVSEQISTAGYEASGTSNMKFALNGAMTIGTLDGATIEIMEEVGNDNIFIFGLTSEEVSRMKVDYRPWEFYHQDPVLKQTVDLIREGFFSPEEPDIFRPLMDSLLNEDKYLVLADFNAYHLAHIELNRLYADPDAWLKKCIINVARIGRFSSDRTIQEYNRDIWKADTVSIGKDDLAI